MPPTAPFENDAVHRIVYLNFAAVLGRKKGTLANGWHACAALAEILNWGENPRAWKEARSVVPQPKAP